MLSKFLSVSIIAAMLIISACESKQETSGQSNITKDEVLAFIKKYDEAWNNKAVAIVDSLFARNYVYFTSTGGHTKRTRSLEVLGADYYRIISADRSELEVWVDSTTAVISSRWQGQGIWKNEPFKDNQRCGMVIQKQNGQLKLLTEHCVEIKVDSLGF